MGQRKIQIGIIGPEKKNLPPNKSKEFLACAKKIGCLLGQKKVTLITGGCSGIAEAAARGAFEQGGITVGTPGPNRGSSVDCITVEICTPVDIGDYLFAGVPSCDSIIVFPGDAGTIAELALAYRYKKPLIFIKGYGENLLNQLFSNVPKDYPVLVALNAEEAAEFAIKAARQEVSN